MKITISKAERDKMSDSQFESLIASGIDEIEVEKSGQSGNNFDPELAKSMIDNFSEPGKTKAKPDDVMESMIGLAR